MLLLAQLVEPPLQPGPIRLPNQPALERQQRDTTPEFPFIEPGPKPTDIEIPAGTSAPDAGHRQPLDWRPTLKGNSPYSSAALKTLLDDCRKQNAADTLNACAAALTAWLIRDGYINSRVYILSEPSPGALEITLGTIAELRISSDDPGLKARAEQQLSALIGTTLHLPTLEKALVEVRRNGVGQIKGNMGRLGSDPTKAVVSLFVAPSPPSPLQGDLSVGNNGNSGSGEWRSLATLLQNDLIVRGDTALLFLELDADGQLEVGTGVISGSYTYPLSDDWSLTGSVGYSYRRFVELPRPAYNYSFRTVQGLVQLEKVLHRSSNQTWSAFTGISVNRTNSYESGKRPRIPLIAGGSSFSETDNSWDNWTRSGFLKLGTNFSGYSGSAFWNANVYLMQGIAGITPNQHLNNLSLMGINPGQARAIGGLADLSWSLSGTKTINLRAAGQVAFNPLPGSMGFSLGSDVGIRGLPGSVVSGDSGWLGTAELVWTVWEQDRQRFEIIPFIGAGGVRTNIDDVLFSDTLGAGGLIGRFRSGRWVLELGWVDSFDTDDAPGIWNNWVLGNGLYSQVRYSF